MSDFFYQLTPEHILDAVESIGFRSTGRCFALNSLENRVYEVEMEDGQRFVGKFYRPNRWSKEAILEEHEFLKDLALAEIPVVPPIPLKGGSTLGLTQDGIYFAVFPKKRGRAPDELDEQQLLQLGRFIARIHNVGASKAAPHRLTLTPQGWGLEPLNFLLSGQWIAAEIKSRYEATVVELVERITPLFKGIKTHRIHGDCHMGNLLYNTDGPFILDFDDMVVGPPVQDLWLITGGSDERSKRNRDVFLSGYTEMREFDRQTLNLVEPLRALRIIHYSAWIAKRWKDPAFPRIFNEFNTHNYWATEAEALERLLRAIKTYSI